MNIFIDIETIPAQPEDESRAIIAKHIKAPKTMSKAETIKDWHTGEGKYRGARAAAIDEEYRSGGLNGTYGEVISVAFSDGGEIHCAHRELGNSETELLSMVFHQIEGLVKKTNHSSKPYFVGHNIQFDLKFLWQRAVINQVNPGFELPFGGRHKSNFFDNMQAWAGFGGRISQDKLAKALGLEGKTDMDGSMVWDTVKRGEYQKLIDYNKQDVQALIDIYNRMNFS